MGVILILARRWVARLVLLAAAGAVVAGCTEAEGELTRPRVVVSTSILANVVENLASNHVEVAVALPAGADPHTYAPSARDVAAAAEATALVMNGGGLEPQAMRDAFDGAADSGVPMFTAIDAVVPLRLGEGRPSDPIDPHFFTDPSRMVTVAERLVSFLSELDGIDGEALRTDATPYLVELATLDGIVANVLEPISDERRVLVTSHHVLGYFAERYDFEIAGVLVEAGGEAQPSAAELLELARVVEARQIRAVFVDASGEHDDIARTLAGEAGGATIVPLRAESLAVEGEASTYTGMMLDIARVLVEQLGEVGGARQPA